MVSLWGNLAAKRANQKQPPRGGCLPGFRLISVKQQIGYRLAFIAGAVGPVLKQLIPGIYNGLVYAADFGAGETLIALQGNRLEGKFSKMPLVLYTNIGGLLAIARVYIKSVLARAM